MSHAAAKMFFNKPRRKKEPVMLLKLIISYFGNINLRLSLFVIATLLHSNSW